VLDWRLPNSLSRLPSTQQVGVLVELHAVMRDSGFDAGAVCRELAIDPALLADMENQIPFDELAMLLLKCSEATGQPDFGVIIGAEARLKHLGPVGRLLACAANLGDMLRDFVANHRLHVRGAGPCLMTRPDDGLLIGCRTHQSAHPGARSISLAAMSFGFSVFEELTELEPAAVLFSCALPCDVELFRKAFGRAQLRFDAEHFGLLYRSGALTRPAVGADGDAVSEYFGVVESDEQPAHLPEGNGPA
jgi:hypothetical protein